MGSLDHPVAQNELQLLEKQYSLPLEGRWTETREAAADGHPLDAARGIVLAAGLGGLFWAAILWAVL